MNTEATLISAICKNKDISTILADNVDDLFTSHKDVWDGLKSYYYKFKAIPEVGILTDKYRDFESVEVKAETGYYLEQLKTEYLTNKLKTIILRSGAGLKEDAPSRIIAQMQSELAGLSKFTSNVRDLDVTDLNLQKSISSKSDYVPAQWVEAQESQLVSKQWILHTQLVWLQDI